MPANTQPPLIAKAPVAPPNGLAAIKQAAASNGLNWRPLAAVAHYESGLNPTAIGDGGHAFGLFQNNNAGGTITGDPNPQRFFNPNVSAQYAARAIKALGIQNETPQQQVADIVNRYERPAKPLPEIQGAQAYLATLGSQPFTAPANTAPGVNTQPTLTQPKQTFPQPSLLPLQRGLDLNQQSTQTALNALNAISGGNAKAAAAPDLTRLINPGTALSAPAHTVSLHSSAPVPTHLDAQGQKAVELAKTYLGTKYVFGGASPKTGFDCSGLLQWTWSKLGVQIPRTSEQQWHAGTPVPKGQIQPGDAVFFVHPGGDVGHVGMAIGNGQYIEAPHTGDVVKIANLADATNFIGARRFA